MIRRCPPMTQAQIDAKPTTHPAILSAAAILCDLRAVEQGIERRLVWFMDGRAFKRLWDSQPEHSVVELQTHDRAILHDGIIGWLFGIPVHAFAVPQPPNEHLLFGWDLMDPSLC